jgi:hypothetical protein
VLLTSCQSGVLVVTPQRAILKHGLRSAMMDFVSTAIVVAIVVVLMLLGIGMVVNQLLRLRKWLNAPPPDQTPGDETLRPPE